VPVPIYSPHHAHHPPLEVTTKWKRLQWTTVYILILAHLFPVYFKYDNFYYAIKTIETIK
jgi:hypothetical protein